MLPNRPYILRAYHQWIIDNNCTPILVLDANHPRCKVPKSYAEGGEIVFNISTSAIRDLKLLNDVVEFKASFSGVIHIISAPIAAVLALYAEENGEGIFFEMEEDEGAEAMVPLRSIEGSMMSTLEQASTIASESITRAKPFLKLVE